MREVRAVEEESCVYDNCGLSFFNLSRKKGTSLCSLNYFNFESHSKSRNSPHDLSDLTIFTIFFKSFIWIKKLELPSWLVQVNYFPKFLKILNLNQKVSHHDLSDFIVFPNLFKFWFWIKKSEQPSWLVWFHFFSIFKKSWVWMKKSEQAWLVHL